MRSFSIPLKKRLTIAAFMLLAGAGMAQPAQKLSVGFAPAPGALPLVASGKAIAVVTDTADHSVVQIAAADFCADIQRVTGKLPQLEHILPVAGNVVIAGTVGHSEWIDQLVQTGKLHAEALTDKWESYSITLVDKPFKGISKALVIAGSDKRGTAYGLFELSRMMGVQPFYWWADIKPAHHDGLYVSGSLMQGPPSVKYRGIFINDEDWGMQPWAAQNMDTDIKDIGPKTYEKIFELLLRLKANYIWPAMHPCTKAFWYYEENPKMAAKYGIVLGASHCEPMLRNNVFEWAENYEHEYNKKPGEWRYDLNRDQIYNYWNDRVLESVNNDAVYTIGMRGIHDGSMPGPKDKSEKVKLLEQVIRDQRVMLARGLEKPAADVPQIFCPYKEVLNLYQAGMKLPDDVTIAWADDNHGYIRQLSNPEEQKRSGGAGVYYHLSYWGAPKDYLWLSSNSPALIAYEMNKAYRFGAGNLWVFNVGDLKPAELETQFCMDLAWNVNAWTPQTAHNYAAKWAAEVFGKELAAPIAHIKAEYYRLAANAKPEHVADVAFSDEAAMQRLKDYKAIAAAAEALRPRIPARLQDAYFELIDYPVQGACLMNEKILCARKSIALAQAGDKTALSYAAEAKRAFEKIQELTVQYNTKIAGGKWNGMMSWHPRDQQVFDMPPVATEAMVAAGNAAAAKPSMDEGMVIPASKYSKAYAPAGASVKTLDGLGIDDKGISVLPYIEKSFNEDELTNAPYTEYQLKLSPGQKQLTVKCLPTFRIYDGLAMCYGVSVNGGPVKMISINTQADTRDWGVNVLRGYAQGQTDFEVTSATTPVTIRLYLPDPGLVVNTLTIK